MIIGHVAPRPEPVVPITLVGPDGVEETIEAVVDTGYSGLLTLSSDLVRRLNFPLGPPVRVLLAGNTTARYDTIEARMRWDGELRDVFTLQMEGTPLIGLPGEKQHPGKALPRPEIARQQLRRQSRPRDAPAHALL
jgi:predicted aspartyl protease